MRRHERGGTSSAATGAASRHSSSCRCWRSPRSRSVASPRASGDAGRRRRHPQSPSRGRAVRGGRDDARGLRRERRARGAASSRHSATSRTGRAASEALALVAERQQTDAGGRRGLPPDRPRGRCGGSRARGGRHRRRARRRRLDVLERLLPRPPRARARPRALHRRSSATLITTLCDPSEQNWPPFTHYQCLHGIGHGLMLRTGYALDASLDLCTRLADDWSRQSCDGGVFMESFSPSLTDEPPPFDAKRPARTVPHCQPEPQALLLPPGRRQPRPRHELQLGPHGLGLS